MLKYARLAALAALALPAACGRAPEPIAAPAPTAPGVADRYAALPDTTVCVVDRTTDRGLRDLAAKRDGDRVVLLVDDQIRALDELHPISLVAGYAGRETWFARGQPVTAHRRQYLKYRGERRVPLDKLKRLGEYQGIPLFAAPNDTVPPPALYVPIRLGCIFQPYLRDDIFRGG